MKLSGPPPGYYYHQPPPNGSAPILYHHHPHSRPVHHPHVEQPHHPGSSMDLARLERKIKSLEAKNRYLTRAHQQLVRDVRADTTKVRLHWEELKYLEDTDEETDEIDAKRTKTLMELGRSVHEVLQLGKCPLSGEPLGETTFFNPCGHLFDRNALNQLDKHQEHVCPKCSESLLLDR
jgi:hypothetical protein